MPSAVRRGTVLLAAASLGAFACGQKGPPLAPLQRVPEAATELAVRRVEDRVRLHMLLPVRNVEGPGPVALDRVQVFAVTRPPGAPAPSDADLFANANLVGELAVRPEPVEGEALAAGDARPAPGEVATFEEELTPAALTPATAPEPSAQPPDRPVPSDEPPPAGLPGAGTQATPGAPVSAGDSPAGKQEAPATGQDGPAGAKDEYQARVYAVRGVTRGGRSGPPSARVTLPLLAVPPAPTDVAAEVIEAGVRLDWVAPADAADASYNVYLARDDQPLQPVNPAPVKEASFEHAGVTLGEEHCYRVRSLILAGEVPIEGGASDAVCVTPRDVFPPAPPVGLTAVPTEGQISLIWDANTEPDIAGYLVLRGEAPDGPLKALMTEPIRETSYRDASVTPGVRYVYAVVAIDQASPPNPSAQSERIEETAR